MHACRLTRTVLTLPALVEASTLHGRGGGVSSTSTRCLKLASEAHVYRWVLTVELKLGFHSGEERLNREAISSFSSMT